MTDAHAVLGRIDPATFLQDGDATLAHDAFEPLAADLDSSVADAAAGVLRVANANMARALRVVSVERGHDPRQVALVAFGGAGPLHAAAIAADLGIPEVVVPRAAGVLSALGLLVSDVVADESVSRVRPWDDVDRDQLEATFADLEASARARLGDGEGRIRIERTLDVRYAGQSFDLRVEAEDLDAVPERFHAHHDERYGYAAPDDPLELVTVRVRARRVVDPPDIAPADPGGTVEDAHRETRTVRFGTDSHETPVFDRERLPLDSTISGPAVVEGPESTVVVRPGDTARVDGDGNLRVEVAHD